MNLTPILTNSGLCPTQAAADQAAYAKYQAEAPRHRDRVVELGAGERAGADAARRLEPRRLEVEQPVPPEAPG